MKLQAFDYEKLVKIHEVEGYADVAVSYHFYDSYKPLEYLKSLGFSLGETTPYTGFYRISINKLT